jgi:hypothetical protein
MAGARSAIGGLPQRATRAIAARGRVTANGRHPELFGRYYAYGYCSRYSAGPTRGSPSGQHLAASALLAPPC